MEVVHLKEANKILGRKGQFWQEDYFDRYIRDDSHFHDAVTYIEFNPVAGCVNDRKIGLGRVRGCGT